MIEHCIFHNLETGRFIYAQVCRSVLHLLEINGSLSDDMLRGVLVYTNPDDIPSIFMAEDK